MPKITISYRRADAPSDAGRIFDRLNARYGKESVFMDIDTIPFGVDFRDYVEGALRGTDIVLAVIGPRWLGRRGARARIQEETDPVRIEIEAAMRLGKVIVPVLVANAVMPSPSDLPDSIAKLSFLNAAEVDPGKDFHANLDRLIRFIDALPVAASDTVAPVEEAKPEPAPIDAAVVPEKRTAPIAPPLVPRPVPPVFDPSAWEPRRDVMLRPVSTPTLKPSEYARRVTAAWWVSMIRGVMVMVDGVASAVSPAYASSPAASWFYHVFVLSALIVMASAVRGRNAAFRWFLIAAVSYLAYTLVASSFRSPSTIVIINVFITSRGLAELGAGVVLKQYVRAERLRVVFGTIVVVNQALSLLETVWHVQNLTAFFYVTEALSAASLIALGWLLRREKLAADRADGTASRATATP
jgi:uncharacterized membrane protein HdeD (DUF308 family)